MRVYWLQNKENGIIITRKSKNHSKIQKIKNMLEKNAGKEYIDLHTEEVVVAKRTYRT